MNEIIQQILNNWNQFNQVKKTLKKQVVQNHVFQVDQKFQIIDKVGKGSYSIVVAAVCNDLKSSVSTHNDKEHQERAKNFIAIKKMENIFSHTTFTKKALRQLRGYRLMKHPNILQLHTIQLPLSKEEFHEIYCIFELMDTNLQKVLQKSEQDLNEDHWRFFMYQILRALKYMHSAGMVHGNLSTKACLVNDICDLKLCEFSQITLISNPNRLDIVCQEFDKIQNPAPELLLKDKQYTPAIDIWSAGCIFAEIIDRKPFFQKNHLSLQVYCEYVGNPKDKCHQYLSEDEKHTIKKLQKIRRQPKDFKKLFPLLSENGVDLLKKMLVFEGFNRITAEQALNHPYFSQLHSDQFQPKRQGNYDLQFEFQFQNFQYLKTQNFKELLFEQILLYHSIPLRNEYNKKMKKCESLMHHILKHDEDKNQKGQTLDNYIERLIDKGIQQQEKLYHKRNLV